MIFYVDTSVVATALLQPKRVARLWPRIQDSKRAFSSSFLVAEVLSVVHREGGSQDDALAELAFIQLLFPERSFAPECKTVLETGYLRGGDLCHVASALVMASPTPGELTFVTLDDRQREVARKLGFRTL